MIPSPAHLESKRVQSSLVSRHTVIADMSSDYRFQPRSNFRNGVMHSFPEFCFDQLQFGSHLFLNRLPNDREHLVPSFLPANMRETKKVKCFRSSPTSPLAIVDRKRTKLNEPSFIRVQFQV